MNPRSDAPEGTETEESESQDKVTEALQATDLNEASAPPENVESLDTVDEDEKADEEETHTVTAQDASSEASKGEENTNEAEVETTHVEDAAQENTGGTQSVFVGNPSSYGRSSRFTTFSTRLPRPLTAVATATQNHAQEAERYSPKRF